MRPDRAGVLSLTDWLHDFFQSLAGSTPTDDPVTFGDLWGNGGDENAPRDIELVLMTTNVTRGISHRFPFLEGSWGQLYFDSSEFDELFPKSVVARRRDSTRGQTRSARGFSPYSQAVANDPRADRGV